MTKKIRKHRDDYTPELGDQILQLVATHTIGLKRLCAMYPEIPSESTIKNWRLKYPEFGDKYQEAKAKQVELLADEILEIADDKSNDYTITEFGRVAHYDAVVRARLQIDTRKWLMSKLMPKKYGNMIPTSENTYEDSQLRQEILMIREKLNQENRREY